MLNNIILSICIPTYNREWKVRKQISELLKLNDERFNIVVSDNKSTDGTDEYLSSISSDQLVYNPHCESVMPAANAVDSLLSAVGRYSLFVLDKDYVDSRYLSFLLDFLEKNEKPYWGYCNLNDDAGVSRIKMISKEESLDTMSYLCKHPSGYFFHTKEMKEELSQCRYLVKQNFPFILDVVCAHMAAHGFPSMIVYAPIVKTETIEESRKTISYTYNTENLWFAPKQVVKRYKIFVDDLLTFDILPDEKKCQFYKLLKRCFEASTIQYASYMNDDSVCLHYNIEPRNYSLSEMFRLLFYAYKEMRDYYSKLWIVKKYYFCILYLTCVYNIIKYKRICIVKTKQSDDN